MKIRIAGFTARRWLLAAAIAAAISMQAISARAVTLTVEADKPGARINSAMWGIFFEDINFGGDGGLYAELVKNRSFEFPDPLMGWTKISPSLARGELSVRDDAPFDPANPHYLRIESRASAPFGISNEGFRGMGVRKGEAYDFSAQVRSVSGSPAVLVQLYGGDGSLLDSVRLSGLSRDWKECAAKLHPNDTDARARLVVLLEGRGAVDFDMVSLFPEHTWKNRPGGLRADMVQLLADLKPGFMRFPGGCIVEGSQLDRRYQWKNTIGPVADRQLLIDRWNYEFLHRPTPDYFQSFGLGFFEFFQLCEDIGAEPLPILNCGMACQFNSGELCPMDKLDTYIQDALDLVEFANGPASSPWGAKRAAMGHPAPFNMKMMGVGNEQWGPQYIERYVRFSQVLKEKYPDIQLVSDAGPSPADDRFRFLWPKLCELKADIVDQHCYANPVWFLSNADRYDRYDRTGPKIFMGEYAAQSVAIVSTKNRNNLECALAEAAYMTGLERNADVVRMASYAPLFSNVEAWQWTPDLIWVDSLRSVATPNYYVQQLFSRNRGDVVLPVSNDAPVQTVLPAGKIGLGTYHTVAEFRNVRVTRGDNVLLASDFSNGAQGWTADGSWVTTNGCYRQTDGRATANAAAGENSWIDYTVTLQARKLGGSEGFLIRVCDRGPEDYAAWNIGGWGNKFHGIVSRLGQQDQLIAQAEGSIESGKWYDVKIVLRDSHMDCYLDGRLVQSADLPIRRVPGLFASATAETGSGDMILKVVNPGPLPVTATIQWRGAQSVSPAGQATVLAGDGLADENSFERPAKVVPVIERLSDMKPEFNYTFRPQSMTVLRASRR